MSKRRLVVAYRIGGSDTVLFDCGHVCVLSADPGHVKDRRPYPKHRMCHRCPSQPLVDPDVAAFLASDRYAYVASTDEERAEYAERKAKRSEQDRLNHIWWTQERALDSEIAASQTALMAEVPHWRDDEVAVGEGFCTDPCEHHPCRLARALARYEQALSDRDVARARVYEEA